MMVDSQGTLTGKDKVVGVEEETEQYEPIYRGKGSMTEDPEQVPGKPNVFGRASTVPSSTNCVSETTILSSGGHQVTIRELVSLMQTKLSDGDEEGFPLLKLADQFPPTFGFATDLLAPTEVCTLEIFNHSIIITNEDTSPMNLDLDVGAYEAGEGNESSMITIESTVDMVSHSYEVSQICVMPESYFPYFVILLDFRYSNDEAPLSIEDRDAKVLGSNEDQMFHGSPQKDKTEAR